MSRESHCNSDVLAVVRARFVARHTTLAQWCRAQGIDPSWAWKVLKGEHVGPKSMKLRHRILAACMDGESAGKLRVG